MYKLVKDTTGQINSVFKTDDKMYIPFDPNNTDYQRYLVWVGEGNTPLPPDDV